MEHACDNRICSKPCSVLLLNLSLQNIVEGHGGWLQVTSNVKPNFQKEEFGVGGIKPRTLTIIMKEILICVTS